MPGVSELEGQRHQTETQELCDAVASWLCYKSLTGLKSHLHEAMMGVPIAEYLSTKHGKEIESEVKHPVLDTGGKGRPKQVDFVRRKKRGGDWHAVYECKYQTDTPIRLISDIGRLLTLRQSSTSESSMVKSVGNPKRYFVFAGERDSIDRPLDRKINMGKDGHKSVFEGILLRRVTDLNDIKRVNLNSLNDAQTELFRSFAKSNTVLLPSVFLTRLKGIAISAKYSCAVWEISSAKGSKLLSHEHIGEVA
jgi:hypothetical protein